jgi:hypothetical protein
VSQKLPKALLQEATDAVDPTRRTSPALVSQIRRDGKLPGVLGLLCEGHQLFGVVGLTTSCEESNEAQPQSISPQPRLQYHESIPIRRKF